jgi:hypothetical protein
MAAAGQLGMAAAGQIQLTVVTFPQVVTGDVVTGDGFEPS